MDFLKLRVTDGGFHFLNTCWSLQQWIITRMAKVVVVQVSLSKTALMFHSLITRVALTIYT